MEVCGLWRFNCNLPSHSWWCVTSTHDKSQFNAGPRSVRPQGAASNVWWFMNAKLYTWCSREICRQCYEFNNLSHMCTYSAILRLKIINNTFIEAIKLSKVPHGIWERVALSEISDGVVLCNIHQSVDLTWDTGHIGYIQVDGRTVMDTDIYLFITGETLFCLIFSFFPQSTLLKDLCILLLMKPAAFYFWMLVHLLEIEF